METTEDEILSAIEIAFDPGNFFTTSKLLFAIMSFDEVVLLSYLWGVWRSRGSSSPWFACTVDQIQREMFVSEDVQCRILKRLFDNGYISRRQRGTRQFSINKRRIATAVSRHIKSFSVPQNHGTGTAESRDPVLHNKKVRAGRVKRHGEHSPSNDQTNTTKPMEDGMPFVVCETPVTKTTPTKQDEHDAAALRAVLLQGRRACGPYNQRRWADQIRLIRERDQFSEEEVHTVVAWLRDHLTDQYTPHFYNAEGFRKKFAAIRDAMLRSLRGATAQSRGVTLPPGRRAKVVAERLGGLIWPEGTSKDDEPYVIETSLRNHDELCLRLKCLQRRTWATQRVRRYADHLLHELGTAEVFVERWMRDLHKMARNWKQWRGGLRSCSFHQSNKHFAKQSNEWLYRYSGDDKGWDEVLTALQRMETTDED